MRPDRMWMYNERVFTRGRISKEWLSKMEGFDNSRKFLPPNHKLQSDKKSFKKGNKVTKNPPRLKSGMEILAELDSLGLKKVTEVGSTEVNAKIAKTCGWSKRSTFWDLPYWKDLLLRHIIDVMHTEKNAEVVEGRLEAATEDVGEGHTPTAVDEAKIYYDAVNGLLKKQRVYDIGTCGKTYYSDSYRSTSNSSYPSFDAFQKMKDEMQQGMIRLMEEKLREERENIRQDEREIIRRDERDSIRQGETQRTFQEQLQE